MNIVYRFVWHFFVSKPCIYTSPSQPPTHPLFPNVFHIYLIYASIVNYLLWGNSYIAILIKIKNLILDCRNLRICAREIFTNNSTLNVFVFFFFVICQWENLRKFSQGDCFICQGCQSITLLQRSELSPFVMKHVQNVAIIIHYIYTLQNITVH